MAIAVPDSMSDEFCSSNRDKPGDALRRVEDSSEARVVFAPLRSAFSSPS